MNTTHDHAGDPFFWRIAVLLVGVLALLLWLLPCRAAAAPEGVRCTGIVKDKDIHGQPYHCCACGGGECCWIESAPRQSHTPLLPGPFLWQERGERMEVAESHCAETLSVVNIPLRQIRDIFLRPVKNDERLLTFTLHYLTEAGETRWLGILVSRDQAQEWYTKATQEHRAWVQCQEGR